MMGISVNLVTFMLIIHVLVVTLIIISNSTSGSNHNLYDTVYIACRSFGCYAYEIKCAAYVQVTCEMRKENTISVVNRQLQLYKHGNLVLIFIVYMLVSSINRS